MHLNMNEFLLTPECKIKMGKYMYNQFGIPVLDVKKSKSSEHEQVPITTMIDILSQVNTAMLSEKYNKSSSI